MNGGVLPFLPVLVGLAALVQAGDGAVADPPEVERRLAEMGTWFDLTVRATDRETALTASEAAVRAVEACEARLSTWREDSELVRLNRAPLGVEVVLSEELADDLARAGRFWRLTGGAFDPGLGALVAAWGLREGGRSPSADELRTALDSGGFSGFELEGRRAVRRRPAAAIEEGGFGKGLALDAAESALRRAGAESAVLDLGGQVLVFGRSHRLALADPAARERAVLELELSEGSLSTSGNSERGIVVDGVRRGHLLDPRTGEPAPDFGSLSVLTREATAADCLSTGLYVLGPEEAFRWCARADPARPALELVVLERAAGRLRARATAGLRGHLRALDPELELEFVSLDSPLPRPQLSSR
jgi:thiamine biosynthesis lipoprotein